MKKKQKKDPTLVTPRGKEAWEARRRLRSTQVPNKRALASKEACRGSARPTSDE